MARRERVGSRSGIGAAALGGQMTPRTEVPVPQRRGRFAKRMSPHGGRRTRRSGR